MGGRRMVEALTEYDMIAAFVRAELHSERLGSGCARCCSITQESGDVRQYPGPVTRR